MKINTKVHTTDFFLFFLAFNYLTVLTILTSFSTLIIVWSWSSFNLFNQCGAVCLCWIDKYGLCVLHYFICVFIINLAISKWWSTPLFVSIAYQMVFNFTEALEAYSSGDGLLIMILQEFLFIIWKLTLTCIHT